MFPDATLHDPDKSVEHKKIREFIRDVVDRSTTADH